MARQPPPPPDDDQHALEAVPVHPANQDPPPPVNMRMARAGMFVLEGMSTYKALRRAGYAHSTAKKPRGNGLTAERCLAEAAKLDRSADPMTLLSAARRVAIRQVRAIANLPDADLATGKARSLPYKLLEVAERYHGKGAELSDATAAVALHERAAKLRLVLDLLSERGIVADPRVGHGGSSGQG